MAYKNLNSFNLDNALQGKSVITRDGKPVKIAGFNKDANEECVILGWINEDSFSWCIDGKLYLHEESNNDLFMAPEKKDIWVCLWKKETHLTITKGFSKKDAEYKCKIHKGEIITTVKIWDKEI